MSAPATSRAGLPGRASRGTLRDRRRSAESAPATPPKHRLHWAVMLLLATWVMPFVIHAGPVRLTPSRMTLLLLFVPCLVWLAQGRAGRVRLPDILLLLFSIWCVISLGVVNGLDTAIQTGGIQVLETLTPYLLARCCIRNADDFRALARVLTWIVVALLPFAIFETVTGRNIYLELSSHILPSIGVTDKDPRWGLRRVQLFFEHPILMGVCCGSVLALTHLVVGRELSFTRKWMASIATGLTATLSLSSGPLSGLLVQIALMGWNRLFGWLRARWLLLISLIGLALLAVSLFARRPLPNILLSFAFDPDSAFFRLLIWTYGTRSIGNHPWFGVGMGSWDRPAWMGPSIDMFWLYNAIIYGLPAGLLMLAFFAAATISVGLVRNLSPLHYDYRLGYLIGMASFFLTGWMVHFWNGTYVFFLFMVGAGLWLCDVTGASQEPAVRQGRVRARQRLSRSEAARQRTAPDGLLGEKLEPVDR